MGKHYLLNLYGCPFELLDNEQLIIEMLTTAAHLCKATILNTVSHKFQPQGVTSILLLAESHISIHTCPECGTAYADVYTCSSVDPVVGCLYIVEKMGATHHDLKFVQR
jgi:S-adenosylmethionine decarboxylase